MRVGLLVIDMQNGFCSPDGGMAKAGVDNSRQVAVVPSVRELARRARSHTAPIFWSKQVHFLYDLTRAHRRVPSHLQKRGIALCCAGTPDIEIVEELKSDMERGEYIFEKHRSSCFFDTTLDTALRMADVGALLVCGVGTNYCVEATIRDAYARDYDLYVARDCVAGSFPDLHDATLKNVEIYYGEVLSMEGATKLLAAGGP